MAFEMLRILDEHTHNKHTKIRTIPAVQFHANPKPMVQRKIIHKEQQYVHEYIEVVCTDMLSINFNIHINIQIENNDQPRKPAYGAHDNGPLLKQPALLAIPFVLKLYPSIISLTALGLDPNILYICFALIYNIFISEINKNIIILKHIRIITSINKFNVIRNDNIIRFIFNFGSLC